MRYSTQSQQGTILLLSVVFLLLLSVAAVASIRLAAGSLQISNAMLEHNRALQNAERALVLAEEASNDVIDFSGANWFQILPLDSNGKGSGCANGLCFLGEFDNGTTECTASAPLDPKAVFANPENASAAKLSNDSSDIAATYLLVFQCFQPNPRYSLQDRIANPAPSFAWLPQFDVLVRSEGRDSDTELVLMSQVLLPPLNDASDLPGILSVRENLVTKSDSNILSYYCKHCFDTDLDLVRSGEIGTGDDILFNPSLVPGVTHGSLDQGQVDPEKSLGSICGGPARLKYENSDDPNKTYKSNERFCSENDRSKELAKMSNDRFFSQYFGTTDRNEIYQKSKIKTVAGIPKYDDLVFNNKDDPVLILIEPDENGEVKLSGNLSQFGSDNLIIVIKGNLILDPAIVMPKAALIYVAGDLTLSGAVDATSVIAVEGSAEINGAMAIRPNTNPTDLLRKVRPINSHLTSAQRVAWRQGS